jgi:hypothetical protein
LGRTGSVLRGYLTLHVHRREQATSSPDSAEIWLLRIKKETMTAPFECRFNFFTSRESLMFHVRVTLPITAPPLAHSSPARRGRASHQSRSMTRNAPVQRAGRRGQLAARRRLECTAGLQGIPTQRFKAGSLNKVTWWILHCILLFTELHSQESHCGHQSTMTGGRVKNFPTPVIG